MAATEPQTSSNLTASAATQSPELEDDPAATPDEIRKEWLGETLHGINLRMNQDVMPAAAPANNVRRDADRLVETLRYMVARCRELALVPGHGVWLMEILIEGIEPLMELGAITSLNAYVARLRANITEGVRYLAARYCNMYISR